MPNSEEKAQKREELYKKMESGATTTDSSEDEKGRQQAAKTWSRNFHAVLEIIQSGNYEIKSEADVVKALLDSWSKKASAKDEHLMNLVAKLKD